MNNVERAHTLETEIANLEMRAAELRAAADRRPFDTEPARCRRCGGPRAPRVRLCGSCHGEVAVLRRQEASLLKEAGVLRAEHAIATRQTDDLVADIHALQSSKPRGWRFREHVLEVEVFGRFWDGLPAHDGDDDVPPSRQVSVSA